MRNNVRGAFERTNKVAGAALVVLVCLFWAQYLRPQSLGGHAGYVLVSGQSMEPRFHTGDLVLVEKHAGYHPGEVIAYRVPKGDPMAGAQVIHRIVGGGAQHGFVVRGEGSPLRGTVVGLSTGNTARSLRQYVDGAIGRSESSLALRVIQMRSLARVKARYARKFSSSSLRSVSGSSSSFRSLNARCSPSDRMV